MYKRILSIGDIKGQYGKLLSLCDKIKFNPAEDLLVLHGDYLDRRSRSGFFGFPDDEPDWEPEALKVLDWLMERRGEPNIVMLRGNREQMMLDYYMDKEEQKAAGGPFAPEDYGELWFPNGGNSTHLFLLERAVRMARKQGVPEEQTRQLDLMASVLRLQLMLGDEWVRNMGDRCRKYRALWKNASRVELEELSLSEQAWVVFQDIKTGLLDFIGGMPLSHRVEAGGKTFFFSHAGVRPGVPLDEQAPHDLLWIRDDFYLRYRGDTVVVAAHTPVQNVCGQLYMEPAPLPIIRDNMILLDTGAAFGYPLSCVDVLSGQVEQSD